MSDQPSYRAPPQPLPANDPGSTYDASGPGPEKAASRGPKGSARPTPKAQRISFTRHLQLPVGADEAFHLFLPGIFPHTLEPSGTAVPEQSFLSLPSNYAESRRNVFHSQDEDGITNLWLTMGYDAEKRSITYLRATPGSHLGVVEVQCLQKPEGRTAAKVRFTVTQVTDDGSPPSKPCTEQRYDAMVGVWKKRIDEVLRQRAEHSERYGTEAE